MTNTISKEIQEYNDAQSSGDKAICDLLAQQIGTELPEAESKIWHGHPVWFIEGNPIAGYSRQKAGIRLMFWSGASFEEEGLRVKGKRFRDASVFYNQVSEISTDDLRRWLEKSRNIQWDYKNLIKRKGILERLK
jgi:hypothetical protein